MDWPQKDADHVMVTAAEMKAFENQILSSGFPEAALMEKVGQAMSAWLLKHSGLLEDGVVVIVGPGHNGGDGLVVARELHLAGVKVKVWCPLTNNFVVCGSTKYHLIIGIALKTQNKKNVFRKKCLSP